VKSPKTRASETMTEAQFTSFIKGHLRKASRWWKPLSDTVKASNVSRGHYLCNGCNQIVTKSIVVDGKRVNNIFVDHINPVISPLVGFTTWDDFITNLFCEAENLQTLCSSCHNQKSREERLISQAQKENNKNA